MFLIGAFIGTAFGVTIMSILSARSYGRDFDDGYAHALRNIEREVPEKWEPFDKSDR